MKKNFKLSFKQLLLVGIVALTGLQAPTSAYAMSNATQQIIQSEQPSTPQYQERNNFKLYINGKKQNVQNSFLVVNGRTFLPVREVSNLLGATNIDYVGEEGDNGVAYVSKDNTFIEIPIGYTKASVNNEVKSLDSGSRSVKVDKKTSNGGTAGTTYLPVNFLANNLGYQTKYYSDTRIIHLYNTATEPELIQEASGNTSVDLHPFFKEKGGVILEGFVPKTGNYGDCVDLNGDGKIAGADVATYNTSTEESQQLFMDGEFLNLFKSQNPPPKTNGTTTGEESQDKLYTWDGLNQQWNFTPAGSDDYN